MPTRVKTQPSANRNGRPSACRRRPIPRAFWRFRRQPGHDLSILLRRSARPAPLSGARASNRSSEQGMFPGSGSDEHAPAGAVLTRPRPNRTTEIERALPAAELSSDRSIIVAGPLTITMYITWSFITWVDGWVKPLVPAPYLPETYLPFQIPGFGLVIALAGLTTLGFLTANLVGKTLLNLGEVALSRMPVVRGIYKGRSRSSRRSFPRTALRSARSGWSSFRVRGPGRSSSSRPPPHRELEEQLPAAGEYVGVFLPCTPNPTTGFFFYLPRAQRSRTDDPASRTRAKLSCPPASSSPTKPRPASQTLAEFRLRQRAGAAHAKRSSRPQQGASPRPQKPHRRVALEQIEQHAQRLGRARPSDRDRGRRSGGRRRGRRRAIRRATLESRQPEAAACRIAGCPAPRPRRAGADPPRRCGSRPRSRA